MNGSESSACGDFVYISHRVAACYTMVARWWISTIGSVSVFVPKVPHIAIASAMAPDRRRPSISLPAFCLTPHHQHVNIRHSDTEISRICTECRGRSDGRGVFREFMLCCTVIAFVGVISNAGFMLTDNIMFTSIHNSVITAAVVRVPCFTVKHPSFQ